MKIGLDKKDYELFVKDATKNCIVVGGACKNNCFFCSCKVQMAVGLKNWTNYISIEDLDSVLDYINPNEIIFMGEGVSFLSCEPFQHPNYLDLIERVNQYYPNARKETTSVCKNINSFDYQRIINSGINISASVNTFDKKLRSQIMSSKDDYYGMVRFLKECEKAVMKISLIYTGELDILKRDLERIAKINEVYLSEKHIMLRLVDYSKYHNQKVKMFHEYSKKTWYEAVRYFDENVKYPSYWIRSLTDFPENVKDFEYATHNLYSSRRNFEKSIEQTLEYFEENLIDAERVGFLFAESVYDYARLKFPYLNAIKVKNFTFGGSYISARLLSKNDFLNAILKENKKYESYVTSLTIFDKYGRDIMQNKVIVDYPISLYLI